MYTGTQRVLMFVGPDRCGKTNIAQSLARATDIPYFKATSEHDAYLSSKTTQRELFLNQLRYADPRVFDVLKQAGWSVIFDRGYPCEFAYSSVMGRETDMAMLRHMDEMWASLGTQVVICHRGDYTGIVDDIDSKIDTRVLEQLHNAYWEFATWTKCSVHKLNVDDEDIIREVRDVLEFIGWDNRAEYCGAV